MYLKPRRVAADLDVTPRTVVRWITEGHLPAVKVGRVWRIDSRDLELFLKRRRTKRGRVQSEQSKAV